MTTQAHDEPWFTETSGFFGADYLSEYQEVIPPEKSQQQVDFLRQALELKSGTRIYDVACGHGRHAVELAKHGCEVTGVDINRHFLEVAERSAQEAGVNARFVPGDMREAMFDGEFDVALNLFTALGYFETEDDDRKVFAAVHRSLRSEGRFLVDFISRDWLARHFRAREWRTAPDGSVVLIERTHDPIRGRNTDDRIRIKPGATPVRVKGPRLRVYTPAELVNIATSVGFRFERAYGNYDQSEYTMDSERAILVFVRD